MIKVRGRKVTFTGKDARQMKQAARDLGMSPQHILTGMLWEYIMKLAREGVLKGKKK